MIEIFAQNHEVDFMEIDTLDCGLAFFPWLPKDDISYLHDTPTHTITHIQKCNLALILPSFSTLFYNLQKDLSLKMINSKMAVKVKKTQCRSKLLSAVRYCKIKIIGNNL